MDDDEVRLLHAGEEHRRLSRKDVHFVGIGFQPRPQGHVVGQRHQGVWESVVIPGLLWDTGGGKRRWHAGVGSGVGNGAGTGADEGAAAGAHACAVSDSVAGPVAFCGSVILPASILGPFIVVGY